MVPRHAHPHIHNPKIEVSSEELRVDDRTIPTRTIVDAWVRQTTDFEVNVVGFAVGNGLGILGTLMWLVGAPLFFWLVTLAGGCALIALSVLAAYKIPTCYELVVRTPSDDESVAHTDDLTAVERAVARLQELRVERTAQSAA